MFSNDAFYVERYKKEYFEGWYLKVDNKDITFAVIFGISQVSETDRHSFIQVFNTRSNEMKYHRFNYEEFHAEKDKLYIKIGDNILTEHGIVVNVENFYIDLKFNNMVKYEKNIMGFVRMLPKLECFHGLLSVHQKVEGISMINNIKYDIDAIGYMEKDYGTSMPKWWIWTHMANENSSFMLSLARVKYLSFGFDGSIGFVYINNHIYTLASYAGFKASYKRNSNQLIIEGENKEIKFSIEINAEDFITLKAPVNGVMSRDIDESLSASANLTVYIKASKTNHEIKYKKASLELVNID